MKKAVRGVVAATILMTVSLPQAWAWGRAGHRLTALVAENYLTSETKLQIAELLSADSKGRETLADIAAWADSYRQEHPKTAGWHFVDISAGQAKFDRQRDCPASSTDTKSPWRDCVTDRILYFEGRLGDTSLPPRERALALKFLVHLIGDVHQPFHALGDARGGNDISVSFLGSSVCDTNRCNLHGVWDDAMIQERNLSEPKYLARLEQEIAENHWDRLAGGEPTTWANISHKYAVDAMVPTGAVIGRDYYEEEGKIMDAQLALGGLRLAHVLNRILSDTAAPAPVQSTATK
ncbi:S1/P1 Nuclease [Bryocella elongata]|uniref:S1/P1 Nuclease n=2 Tax=Bryocella elongata TaxID=863522 RepID=A0A1H6CJ67_9BACT|nr:S1/P1 Nuclease [Bryocella elongata]